MLGYGLAVLLAIAYCPKTFNLKACAFGIACALVCVHFLSLFYIERSVGRSSWTEYQYLFEADGVPVPQLLTTFLYIFLPLAFCADHQHKYRLAGLSLAMSVCLGWQYRHITYHSPVYTRHPGQVQRVNQYKQRSLKFVYTAVECLPGIREDTTEYPAGWLDTSAVLNYADNRMYALDAIRQICARSPVLSYSRLWHSGVTGIYRLHATPSRVWYPGGKPRDGLKGLQLRPHRYTTIPTNTEG